MEKNPNNQPNKRAEFGTETDIRQVKQQNRQSEAAKRQATNRSTNGSK
ncbi:gamma-type small acid-soluble spore protein [Paenisporosarcina cavernae]|uniref:Small, acid-soluble spore protein gamma-type n=1 Tax=Paenisporosarcina cavernae TaxID=2320858 RepID=A0A385YX14_9BACL|nr:gamma-type small acid-soluble spore protein [Paenisporosarcina cavernae]AYC30228.1 gamma-type small acid-soluble spore protein [Paenisporosarcina cavernae]